MIGSNLRFGKSISSPFIDPSPAKDRLSLLLTYVKSNFNSHVVTIKKESVDAQIYKFVLRGKHLRARLISSPHLRYIFLRRGGWTDRSMVQSRLSGHGGRVLAAPRRLRLAFPDSVRRRPDAATVGRSARSGHQSASSEPANLSLSLSLALSRARRGARARRRVLSHTHVRAHIGIRVRARTKSTRVPARERAHAHGLPSRSIPPRRTSLLVARRSCEERSPSSARRERESEFLAVPRGCSAFPNIHEASSRCPHVRTHARTQHHRPRSRTTRILPPLFSTARSIRSKDTRRRIFGAVHFVLLSLPALPPFFATASNTLYGIHRSDLVFLASVHPTSLVERRRGTRSLEFPARVTAVTACACAPFRGDSFREDRACDGDGPRDGKSCTHGASARASSPW